LSHIDNGRRKSKIKAELNVNTSSKR